MYLTNIGIENVRGFLGGDAATSLTIPNGPGWYVFAGRNGSGKSTLLRSVALALAGPEFARQLMPSFEGWIRQGEDDASMRVEFVPDKERDSLAGPGNLPKRPMSAELHWKRSKDGPEPILEVVPPRASRRQPRGPWRGPWGENPKGWLVAGYGPFRRLSGHAADAQRAMVGPHHLRRLVSLFREDASLVEVVEWLKNERLKELETREGAADLLAGVKALLNSGLLPDGAQIVEIGSQGLMVERSGTKVDLRSLSDGYRVALALVLDVIRHMQDAFGFVEFEEGDGRVYVNTQAVVLIDEVDAHLHVSWQQTIGEWLKDRFPNVQFLVTTHSPFVCQSASDGGLFRLPAPGEQRGVELADEETFKQVVFGTANDAVLSKLFGMEHSMSDRTNRMRREWSQLQAKKLRGTLKTAERTRLVDLTKQLPLPYETSAAE
jgi:hypothetical protein